MNLYKYDSNTLEFKPTTYMPAFLIGFAIPSVLFLFGLINAPEERTLTPEEKVIVINEANKFSEEKLINEIDRLNFRFPHIVLAQAQIESGHFSSTIFNENNNMFGMREAAVRAHLARGTNRRHAYYDTWKESLYDYALYYSTYLSKLRTEAQYYSYLEQNYAEDPGYVRKVKSQANKNKELFD